MKQVTKKNHEKEEKTIRIGRRPIVSCGCELSRCIVCVCVCVRVDVDVDVDVR